MIDVAGHRTLGEIVGGQQRLAVAIDYLEYMVRIGMVEKESIEELKGGWGNWRGRDSGNNQQVYSGLER